MDVSTLLLAGAAAYFLISNEKSKEELTQLRNDVKALEDYNDIKETEAAVEEANNNWSKLVYPIGFCGVLGNYYTSDKYVCADWYTKWINKSNMAVTVHIKSASVTILNAKQIWGNGMFFGDGTVTIPANSESTWIWTAHFQDGPLYGYGTVGQQIYTKFRDHRYKYFYRSAITLQYQVSNPYVNNGMSIDCDLVTIEGGVYGVRVYTYTNAMQVLQPRVTAWEDYHIDTVYRGIDESKYDATKAMVKQIHPTLDEWWKTQI